MNDFTIFTLVALAKENHWDDLVAEHDNRQDDFRALLSDTPMQAEQINKSRVSAGLEIAIWEREVFKRLLELPPTAQEVAAHNPSMETSE